MSVLDDLRKKREATASKPVDNDYGSNIPTDSPGESQISQGNGVEQQPEDDSSQNTAIEEQSSAENEIVQQPTQSRSELFLQQIQMGRPYTEAYSETFVNPELNKEEQEKRDRKESARRNIAAFGDAARLLGQGISAFNGGIVNLDNGSMSGANGKREERQYDKYIDRVNRYKEGAYRANMGDLQNNLQELRLRRQQERENLILANRQAREDKQLSDKIALDDKRREEDRKNKSEEAEKQRIWQAGQNAKKNAASIASANIRKGSTSATEDKNYTYYPDGDNVVKIPKSKMSDANVSRIYSELVKEYPDARFKGSAMKNIAGMPIKDPEGNIVYEDKMPTPTQMQQIIGEYAGNSPKAMEIIRSLSEDAPKEESAPVSKKRAIEGFTSDNSDEQPTESKPTKKKISGF